jgi:PBP1b-binding outer membrane lipoprotein LpoB
LEFVELEALNASNIKHKIKRMKRLCMATLAIISATLLLAGCVGLQLGGGSKTLVQKPTVGQQLIDLQKAKETGAMTDSEYQAQKAKALENK